MTLREALLRQRRTILPRVPRFVRHLVTAGTAGYPPEDRDALAVANIIAYIASVSSLSYAATYAFYNFAMLKQAVAVNLATASLAVLVPMSHRLGRTASAYLLVGWLYSTLYFYVAELGHDSGIQLNLLAAGSVAILVLGLDRPVHVVLFVLLAVALHLAAWFQFPTEAAAHRVAPSLLAQIYVTSAVTLTAVTAVAIYYAFWLVREARARSDALLLNVMPAAVAEQLKAAPGRTIAERHEQASVVFADLSGFTRLTARLTPDGIVALLDEMFSAFDAAAERFGVEKIKTIGDAYMAVAGVPQERPDHAQAALNLAFGMLAEAQQLGRAHGLALHLRIGIASGPVMAGVIGRVRFAYDVWGETVNLAARLEQHGELGKVQVSEETCSALAVAGLDVCEREVNLPGIGSRRAFLITRPLEF